MTSPIVDRVRPFVPAHVELLTGAPSSDRRRNAFDWIRQLPADDCQSLVEQLCDAPATEWEQDLTSVAGILVEIIRRLYTEPLEISEPSRDGIARMFSALVEHPTLQALMLRLLVATRQREALTTFARLLVEQPLEPRLQVEIFGDLLKLGPEALSPLFPGILSGLDQPGLASFVLDYANFVYRQKFVPTHPAASRSAQLISLLSSLADRLGTLQDVKPTTQDEATELGRQVTESVALAVALCDAMAGIGDPQAIAALNKILQVEHRRLRVEAAAALAKLGVDEAREMLLGMAADPVERLRVLSYADELDVLEEVDEQFSNVAARAEAEVVMYLGQPTQIGIAPQHIELIDQRELAWPGYEEPRNCFLFQYVYELPQGTFTNIGLAGPAVMTFQADLTHLSHNDMYATFAGWHVDHPEIFATPPERAVGSQQLHMQRLLAVLSEAEEYEDVVPGLIGSFLERPVLVAAATRQTETGWVMVSDDAINWVALGNPLAPIGRDEVFSLFVGRALLASFN